MTKQENQKLLNSIRGLSVAITGACWTRRADLERLIRKQGGLVTSGGKVNDSTEILVRGVSSVWKYEEYGRKEAKVAELIRSGKSIIVVADYEFRRLLELGKPAHITHTIAGQPIEWLIPASEKILRRTSRISGDLDREHTTMGRLEQGVLRQHLFRGKTATMCAICEREFPIEFLVAAHIKPRSECTLAEKRDGANIVFPACLFGCDALYERGVISVTPEGYVTVSKTAELTKSVREHIKNIRGKQCKFFRDGNATYFNWHYERRFRP